MRLSCEVGMSFFFIYLFFAESFFFNFTIFMVLNFDEVLFL